MKPRKSRKLKAPATTTPLFATAGAVLALGERLTPTILLGTLGTVAGVALIGLR